MMDLLLDPQWSATSEKFCIFCPDLVGFPAKSRHRRKSSFSTPRILVQFRKTRA